ncbi:MAG: triphosphoribosyl-dephospho-CoA synthase [Methanobacteriaceae archaeon]|nr:triphosphoribosyl-dephospho-CoA synthase [Methanobacteriaceae archaeon]MDP2837636.1 triphosphoribosyl-dephospho-CoA synthase [Methanobacteriaceae archaeon]MDP3034584.1 triphosphoribosyl-dephospho-CoA synthase [Methanobacteriaceae archaeon]MDP3485681.1 triphosphoribosyl-dephospho-CoA synthase [Methanobacteriaceae archaeon]MDP3624382.1 triphosphoribosyl-dephospho-CoA synthase [Methanobacteriaceae archaeon]
MDPDYIAKSAQIASVLEVSGHPKPGNVHRTQDFHDMVFEDFLISGVVIGDVMRKAALRGQKANENLDFSHIKLGELILDAVKETNKWVDNNTNLGIIMMLTPLSAAAAMNDDFFHLRTNFTKIMAYTTPEDAVNLYKSIALADAGGMGGRENLDVTRDQSQIELRENKINMFDILKISADWDLLASELTTSMPVTFETGFPTFKRIQTNYGTNSATVQTFLTILSQFPDTLISRKYGLQKAQKVSREAKKILDLGGILTPDGENALRTFDKELSSNNLNPGTTADITAASIMVAFLSDY